MKDPVKHCEMYKDEGCVHVDGFLCNYETCNERLKYMEKYCERYDSYYDDETGEWLEVQCLDENCEFCVGRPENFFRIDECEKNEILEGSPRK